MASKDSLLTHKEPMASLSSVLLTGIHRRLIIKRQFVLRQGMLSWFGEEHWP